MPCLHPKQVPNPVFHCLTSKSGDPVPFRIAQQRYLTVPCGHCVNCLSLRQNTWSWRIEQDAFDTLKHDGAVFFVTMTYNDENLPFADCIPSLVKSDVQEYHKKMWNSGLKFRYFTCGEYGDKFSRPHYHEILFLQDWMTKETAHSILFPFWNKCDDFEFRVDSFSLAAAKYVAKYSMKRFGVSYDGVQPPFSIMSLKPVIGSSFFDNSREIQRLRDQRSFTVYDSSGNPCLLPRVFRDKIFSKLEQAQIIRNVQNEQYHFDVLRSGKLDPLDVARFQECQYRSSLFDERLNIERRSTEDFGKDCVISYSDYLLSL